ncbi:hypothetical protein SIN8267_02181 [Sinobacterium norvegicum]|uniref:Sel1 repeat family protein n=1 Tax=Sinobacterium norvegicum TaxID=1641715 RepID=A0ABN8EPA9_9GAMM|nr:tetratricopeptide repeat protein [Sinobacterium norvegicum]CAH0992066.1 hypothetical protein SIN8267_02181 [Sinobacterium norvegicum]
MFKKMLSMFSQRDAVSPWAVSNIQPPSVDALQQEQAFCRQYEALATEAAVELCLTEAQAGIRAAQYFLALYFDSGNAGVQDYQQARLYYYRAALQDSPEAQYNLATLLMTGRGGDQDIATAFDWYQQAAKNGIAQAQFNMASMLDDGYGIKADKPRAFAWYQAAAKQGYPQGCQNLAVMYFEGQGCEQNFIDSYGWAMLAAAAKADGAESLIQALAEKLPHDDIVLAKTRGDELFALFAPELRRRAVQSFDPMATEVVNTALLS